MARRHIMRTRCVLLIILLLATAVVPARTLRAQVVPPGPAPAEGTLSIEERMRQRREQAGGPVAPATSPAAALPAARGASPRSGDIPARGPRVPVATEGPTCTLDATIYDVRLPGNQIGRLDLDALARAAATAEGFEKALAELGMARPLYRANQSIRLAGDMLTMSTYTPYITNSQITATGQVSNTISYRDIGALFHIVGKVGQTGTIELDLSMEVSSLSEGTAAFSSGIRISAFRRSTLSHKGLVEPRRPFVVMTADAASVDADGKAVAYIARVSLGAPQSTTAPARGE